MTTIVDLIHHEEGWRSKPYLCSEGYPTCGFGFRIGPKGADIKLYQFTLPTEAGSSWLMALLEQKRAEMMRDAGIASAMAACGESRQAVLVSMAYQIGVTGLSGFRNTLKAIADGRWADAAKGMLESKWARQTPVRANRHANQMLSGVWAKEYGNGDI
jgi:lysozyme